MPTSLAEAWPRARAALMRRDPVLAGVIRGCGDVRLSPRGDPFIALARSMVGQQISVAAAQSIWTRFEKACGSVEPQRVGRMRRDTFARCGLSARKTEYLRDLAHRFRDGELDPTGWQELDDEAIITQLTEVRGIGRWTAEMFLIFNLQRSDVLPLDDVGLLRAMALHYPVAPGVENDASSAAERHRITRRRAEALAEPWRPWRSMATWYLWRSLDAVVMEPSPEGS